MDECIQSSYREYVVKDNNDAVIGKVVPKISKFYGSYWILYGNIEGTEEYCARNNLKDLLTLSPAAYKLYFVILYIVSHERYYSSQLTLTNADADLIMNRCISSITEEHNKRNSFSKNTFYSGIRELIKIGFIKRVKKDTYKINSNYVFNRKDPNPERW